MKNGLVGFILGSCLCLSVFAAYSKQPQPVRMIPAAAVGPTFSADDLTFGAKFKLYRASDGIETVTIRLRSPLPVGEKAEPFDFDSGVLTAEAALKLERAGFLLERVEFNK